MQDFVDDQMPYKKKSKKKGAKKADHKHDFQPCVFEYAIGRFDKERGMIPTPSTALGTYCTVCGKVGDRIDSWYADIFQLRKEPKPDKCGYSVDSNKELNPETRTIPTFKLNDYWFDKFIPDFKKD